MIGRHVKHRTFGIGSIIGNEAGKITVDFSGTVRLFQFPGAFERFLITDDAVLKSMVDEAIKESAAARKKAEEERRMAKEAEEAAAREAARIVSRIPFPVPGKTHPAEHRAQGDSASVAFKCNFCDGGASATCIGFRGKCSDSMIRYNIEQAKHVWCSTGSVCKSYYDGHIDRAELAAYHDPNSWYSACYESSFFDTWSMSAGIYQTGENAGKPMHLNRIHKGSLAVMTTRKPSDKESDRFIFAVFLIKDAYSGDDQDEGTVTADPVWRIELAPGQAERILFWNYYFNERKPEKIVFGSGLHRYLTDIEAAQILRDIMSVKGDDFSAAFFTHFCEVNGIDARNLSAPYGALMRRVPDSQK